MEARASGDPAAIGQATQRVIALALVEMAKLRLDEKAYDEAAKLCRESLEFEDTAETRVEIAIGNLYAKKLPEAVREASAAAEMDPQNALAWTIKGEALLRSEGFSGAAAALSRAFEIKHDAEPAYALGIAQLGMGDKEAAAKTFSQLLRLTGDFGWSRVLVGRAYEQQAFMKEAASEYQKALQLDPATRNAHYFWALNLLRENEWNPTAKVYEHLQDELRLNPRHFEANYMLGSLASKARNYRDSDQYLQLASKVKPSAPETWVLLGLNAQSLKNGQAAEAYFRRAIELSKKLNPEEHLEVRKAYIGLGRLLMASGKVGEGEQLLAKARELQAKVLTENQKKFAAMKGPGQEGNTETAAPYIPESDTSRPLALSQRPGGESETEKNTSSPSRATTNSLSDSQRKAENHLQVVLGSSFNDLATAEALQEKYDLAWKHYREASGWDAHIPGLQRNLGLAAYFAGQPGEAIRLLSKIVTESPEDEHARAVLGLAYFARGDFAKTSQTLVLILNRAVQDPQLGYALAKSLAETGNKREAARTLQNVDKASGSPSVESLIRFGKLWRQLGDEERAVDAFRRALLLDPENPDAKCALHPGECPS